MGGEWMEQMSVISLYCKYNFSFSQWYLRQFRNCLFPFISRACFGILAFRSFIFQSQTTTNHSSMVMNGVIKQEPSEQKSAANGNKEGDTQGHCCRWSKKQNHTNQPPVTSVCREEEWWVPFPVQLKKRRTAGAQSSMWELTNELEQRQDWGNRHYNIFISSVHWKMLLNIKLNSIHFLFDRQGFLGWYEAG